MTLFAVLVIAAMGVWAKPTHAFENQAQTCRAAFSFAHPRHSYAKLQPDLHAEDFIALTNEIRASVSEKLGFLPEIRRTELAEISDIKLFAPGTPQTKNDAIASVSYTKFSSKKLELDLIWVREDFRQSGLSQLLFSELLALHPEANRVHVSDLVDLNLEKYEEARRSLGKKNSIRETPLYRVLAKFGFTEIKKLKIVKSETHPIQIGDRRIEVVTKSPAIHFDLVRPKQN